MTMESPICVVVTRTTVQAFRGGQSQNRCLVGLAKTAMRNELDSGSTDLIQKITILKREIIELPITIAMYSTGLVLVDSAPSSSSFSVPILIYPGL